MRPRNSNVKYCIKCSEHCTKHKNIEISREALIKDLEEYVARPLHLNAKVGEITLGGNWQEGLEEQKPEDNSTRKDGVIRLSSLHFKNI